MSTKPTSSAPAGAAPKKSAVTRISTMTFAIMIIAGVVSLRGLPSQAEFGLGSIFFYLLAGIVFLVPFSLVAAELGSTFTKAGGVFRWVGEAFGPKWGFVAIFLEWATIIIWFPSVLIFSASALAYTFAVPKYAAGSEHIPTFKEHLASNIWFTLAVVLVVYWLSTLNSFRGLKSSALLSKWGAIIGTLIPAAVLVILGGVWIIKGNKIELPLDKGFIPNFGSIQNVVLAASIFLFFAGIEMNFVHVGNLQNPKKDVPRAVIIAAVLIISIFILATLGLGVVLPEKDINLTQSLLVGFYAMWDAIGLSWMGNVMAAMILVGVLGQVATIIAGPSRGIFVVGKSGYLPPKLQEENKHGVQVPIILVQSVVVTILSFALVVVPSVEAAYQILSQMATITYLMMATIIFISFIYLRKKYPVSKVPRGFQVPGGAAGAWIVAGIGTIGVLAAMIISFFPPKQISTGSPVVYIGILVVGALLVFVVPFIISKMKKPSWDVDGTEFAPFGEYGDHPELAGTPTEIADHPKYHHKGAEGAKTATTAAPARTAAASAVTAAPTPVAVPATAESAGVKKSPHAKEPTQAQASASPAEASPPGAHAAPAAPADPHAAELLESADIASQAAADAVEAAGLANKAAHLAATEDVAVRKSATEAADIASEAARVAAEAAEMNAEIGHAVAGDEETAKNEGTAKNDDTSS